MYSIRYFRGGQWVTLNARKLVILHFRGCAATRRTSETRNANRRDVLSTLIRKNMPRKCHRENPRAYSIIRILRQSVADDVII